MGWNYRGTAVRFFHRWKNPRRDDLGVVENQHIAMLEIRQKVAKHTVLDVSRLPMDHHHPRSCAVGEGMGGDKFRRQMVVEILSQQAHPLI